MNQPNRSHHNMNTFLSLPSVFFISFSSHFALFRNLRTKKVYIFNFIAWKWLWMCGLHILFYPKKITPFFLFLSLDHLEYRSLFVTLRVCSIHYCDKNDGNKTKWINKNGAFDYGVKEFIWLLVILFSFANLFFGVWV